MHQFCFSLPGWVYADIVLEVPLQIRFLAPVEFVVEVALVMAICLPRRPQRTHLDLVIVVDYKLLRVRAPPAVWIRDVHCCGFVVFDPQELISFVPFHLLEHEAFLHDLHQGFVLSPLARILLLQYEDLKFICVEQRL